MQFGIYLVENGIITCEEFFEAAKLQLRSRPQLGGLAIERRKLTVRQVFAVLRQQCDAPADLFGEIAVQSGFLTPEQLAELMHEQARRVKPFAAVLVDLGILSASEATAHYADFRRTMERADVAADELATVDG
jgi:hypothetical protein